MGGLMMRSIQWLLLVAVFAMAQNKLPPEIVNDRFRHVLEVDPIHYKRDLEDDRIRVLRAHLGPGEAVPMHDDRAYVTIAITELHLRLSKPGERPFDVHMKAGESRLGYADMHSIANINTKPADYLVIELKDLTPRNRNRP
jgi:hypothetical protein